MFLTYASPRGRALVDRRLEAVSLMDAEEARHWELGVVFVAVGRTGDVYQAVALCVGAIVCVAAANAGAAQMTASASR